MHGCIMHDVVIYSNKLFVKLKKYYDNVLVFHEKSSLYIENTTSDIIETRGCR